MRKTGSKTNCQRLDLNQRPKAREKHRDVCHSMRM